MDRWGWAFALGLCLLAATPAYAQETAHDTEARTHFESGRSYFDRGAYEEALREFRAAYELSHRAELLYNLYLTTERLADFDAAVDYLEQYLAEGAPDAERRASLEPRLENLRARRDAHTTVETPVTTEPEPVPPPAPSSQGDIVVPAGIAFGVAAAGLLTFAIAGGLALAEDSSLASTCGTSCSDSQVSGLNAMTIAADVGWITAAVAGVTGIVLLVVLAPSSHGETTTLVVPWATPEAGGLALGGSF